MACRGVLFAISDEDLAKLLRALTDEEILTIVQEDIENRWEESWLCELDKAWDAIHRCLTDGKIGFDNGEYPYNRCVLGGQQLHRSNSYIVSLKTPPEVTDLANALRSIDQTGLRPAIDPTDYGLNLSEEDFEYTWEYFRDLPDFYGKAAVAGRHVIFTVDQ
jgi:uncharacterized protein DUF1877